MQVLLLRILLFCLVPVGIFLLWRGIKLILTYTGSAVLLNMPAQQESSLFTVLKEGTYAIWQSGRNINKVPFKMPPPRIFNIRTNETVAIYYTSSTISVNTWTEGRIQMFTFEAREGQYQLELADDNMTDNSKPLLNRLMPGRKGGKELYSIQIREKKPGYLLIAGILLLILGFACMICGFVIPYNIDKICESRVRHDIKQT